MAETKAARARPLSPHIMQWRWGITMMTSILHRATGVGNAIGFLLLTWFLVAAAAGPEAYATFSGFIGSWIGRLLLLGFTWSVCYHLLNGVRHLFWDGGKGFGVGIAKFWSWLVIFLSVLCTAGIWFFACSSTVTGG